jgi:predicted ATPase
MSNHRPKAMITRVRLENYKSIKSCDVQLEPLTFLVGQNASGKSNFLDALNFVSNALQYSFDYAITSRGGGRKIIFRQDRNRLESIFKISIDFKIENGLEINYNFSVKVLSNSNSNDMGSEILSEECRISNNIFYTIKENHLIETSIENPPKTSNNNLYLVRVSGIEIFETIVIYLENMGFYNPNPMSIKSRKINSNFYRISAESDNLAAMMSNTHSSKGEIFLKIDEYLTKIIQDYSRIFLRRGDPPDFGIIQNSHQDEPFWSQNLSDGTLRAIAILFILFQNNLLETQKFLIIGIEEPELALHPTATSVLLDAMREASQETQVLVTTHSPDLLDNVDLENGNELVLAVDARAGQTIIAPIDSASREIVKEHLFSLGDLLRMRQLEPEITEHQTKEHV